MHDDMWTGVPKLAAWDSMDQADFDANRAYWSGRADAARELQEAERRLRDMKGKEVEVVRGRKVPIGTRGTVFYSGKGKWGWRIGFTGTDGGEYWTDAYNVELVSELSSTSSRKLAEENTCRNCDKPCSGEYCSNLCEDMDKHPAPRDDQEKFTSGGYRMTQMGTRKTASLREDVRRAGHSIYTKKDWFDRVLAATSDATLDYLSDQYGYHKGEVEAFGESYGDVFEGVAMHIAETSDIPMYSPAEQQQMEREHNQTMIDKYDRGIDGWSPGDTGRFCKRCHFRDEVHSGGPMASSSNETCNYSYGELVTNPALTYTEYDRLKGTATRKTAGPMGIKVGDIFYSSWGYDQTNIDYYLVVRTTQSMVEVMPINSKIESVPHFTSQNVVPDPNSYRDFDVRLETGRSSPYGQPERSTKMCKVRDGYGGRPTIILNSRSHAYAYPWEGSPLNETAPGFGH